jgi:hypothetical protein
MAKTVLDLFNAEQDKKHNKIEITKELNAYANNKMGSPSVNELLNFYLQSQKGKQPLAKVTSDGTLTMSVLYHDQLQYHGKDKIEIVYYRHVEDENPSKSFEIKFEPDKADDFLVTKFNYENVTATEIKELINLLLFGKRNANENEV